MRHRRRKLGTTLLVLALGTSAAPACAGTAEQPAPPSTAPVTAPPTVPTVQDDAAFFDLPDSAELDGLAPGAPNTTSSTRARAATGPVSWAWRWSE